MLIIVVVKLKREDWGESYLCHSRMRILSGSVPETNSPWSVYFEYAVSYSEPVYVHVHSNIILKKTKQIKISIILNGIYIIKSNIISNKTLKVIMMKLK